MWIITIDLTADKTLPEGTNINAVGKRSFPFNPDKKLTKKFRMKDDDGEVYYIGSASEDCEFEPLDDFGAPNAGCTSIEYMVGGKWEVL